MAKTRKTPKKGPARKAKKEVAPEHQFMPTGTNPNWLKGFVPDDESDWADMHDDLLELMTRSSDAAMANKRNMYAHLNAARYAGIAECLRIVKNRKSQRASSAKIQQLLNQVLYESGKPCTD